MRIKYNKYDILIIISVAALAWGGLEVFRAILPIRVLGLYGLGLYLKNSILIKQHYKNWLVVFSMWIIYVIISILWSPIFSNALLQALHLCTIFGVISIFQIGSIKAIHPLHSLICGWGLMVAITVPIAIWEITTGNHLTSGSHNEGLMLATGIVRNFSAVTFGNLNSYSVVLCYSLPFLFISWAPSNIPCKNTLRVLSVVVSGLILINASRGSVLCLIICLISLFLITFRRKHAVMHIIVMTVFFVGVVYIAINYLQIDIFFQLLERFDSIGMESNREDVYNAGFKIAENYLFFGSGVASTIPLLSRFNGLTVYVTHNFYIEVLIEYGLVIFILLFYSFYKTSYKLFKYDNLAAKFVALYVVLSSFFLFSIDDYYTGESAIWVYIASLMIYEHIVKISSTNGYEKA